jgi:NTE family protein
LRASVAIPFIYQPFVVDDLPTGPAAEAMWRRLGGVEGRGGSGSRVPRRAMFVDGGLVSGFPIDVFHVHDEVPLAPTFGVKLGAERVVRRDITSLAGLAEALWSSASHAREYDFLGRNPDFRHLVEYIHVETRRWLEFAMEEDYKIELFRRGASAAVRFLLGFDWPAYQSFRAAVAAGLERNPLRQTPAA